MNLVTTLERRCRFLLHVYPSAYRRDRAEEMLGILGSAAGGAVARA
jgi:hypothetical protein